MGHQAQKTEHCGSKRGSGAYWGRKVAAKHESNSKRRADDKDIVRNETIDEPSAPGYRR
jgi:hypothetical protein